MTTLTVAATTNYRTTVLSGVTLIDFTNPVLAAIAEFSYGHFDNVQISDSVAINGNSQINTIWVKPYAVGVTSVDASGWTFTNWTDGVDTITLYMSSLADTLTGSSKGDIFQLAPFNVSAGPDTLYGGDGDDIFVVPGAQDILNGGNGFDTLEVYSTKDYSAASIMLVEKLKFLDDGTITLSQAQMAAGAINTFEGPTGNGNLGRLVLNNVTSINLTSIPFTFLNWNVGNTITINGTAAADIITGSVTRDVLVGGLGADVLTGGEGNDDFNFAAGDAVTGEIIDGGAGANTIRLTGAAGSVYDFSGTTIIDVSALRFVNAGTATMMSAQFALNGIGQVFGSAGADALVFNGRDVDLFWTQFYITNGTWVNGIDSVTINGTSWRRPAVRRPGRRHHIGGRPQ